MTARVLVPLVSADGSPSGLFEAIASAENAGNHPAGLLPQIAELQDFGLYRIGQTVREAVLRFIDQRRAEVWGGRRNAFVQPWNLRMARGQVGSLSAENANSAELGFAIAALLQAFGLPERTVFATGALDLSRSASLAAPVAVGPVGGIAGKLAVIGDYIHNHRARLKDQQVVLALPEWDVDGRKTVEAHDRLISRLNRLAEAEGIQLQILPLTHLDGLSTALGPFRPQIRVSPRKLGLAAASAIVIAGAFAIWSVAEHSPIDLQWDGVATSANAAPAPQRAAYDRQDDTFHILAPCMDDQRQPMMKGGETLLIRIRATDRNPFSGIFNPPRYLLISVSRAADPVVMDVEKFRRADQSQTVQKGITEAVAALPIEQINDEIRLFVVATRDRSTGVADLQSELQARLKGLEGASVFTTTASFLNDRFAGILDYQFKVTTDEKACS